MAKFDVYRTSEGWLALDCQGDSLGYLNTRLAIPLMPPAQAPLPATTLNPTFVVDGHDVIMVTQFAASLPTSELGTHVCRLDDQEYKSGRALDFLISGYWTTALRPPSRPPSAR